MPESFGRYETVRAIASGGMATVYLARSVGAGGFERLVAIKALHPHIASEPDFVAMFLDEARLAARVRHPNVVPTTDVHEDPLFLVMDYIEGPSLHTLLRELRRKGEKLPVPIALRIFLDILAGLHAAHELTGDNDQPLNLIHRDVSPHNMLIGVDGIARITDFGVARAESRLSSTRGNQVKGKLAYMAPEQVKTDPIDRRCDVYASGVVLFEMLTGTPLFRAEHDAALIAQVVAGPKQSPRELEPSVPVEIDVAVMRALRNTIEERYATAADFAEALEQAAKNAGVSIASSRELAGFVKAASVHDAAPSGRGAQSGSGAASSRRMGAAALDFSDAPASNPSATRAPLPSSSSSTSVGTLVAPGPEAERGRSKRWLLFAGAGAVIVLLGAVLLTSREPGAQPSAASPAVSETAAASAARPSATPAPLPTPQPERSADATSSSPTSSAKASDLPKKPATTGAPRPSSGKPMFRPDGL